MLSKLDIQDEKAFTAVITLSETRVLDRFFGWLRVPADMKWHNDYYGC